MNARAQRWCVRQVVCMRSSGLLLGDESDVDVIDRGDRVLALGLRTAGDALVAGFEMGFHFHDNLWLSVE